MAFVAAPLVVAGLGGARWYFSKGKDDPEHEPDEDAGKEASNEASKEGAASKEEGAPQENEGGVVTWKESAGRESGRDGYVFGDVTRGITRRVFGAKNEDATVEEAADERFTQVQRLVRDAAVAYKARGYGGTITITQRVGLFTESCSISVTALKGRFPALADAGDNAGDEAAALAEHASKAGRVFGTLFARLERRAKNWEKLSGVEGLDPVLGTSAQIGFALPVVKVGWGVSISFSISKSSLLCWANRVTAVASDALPAPSEQSSAVLSKTEAAALQEEAEEKQAAQAAAAEAAAAAAADDDF